MDETSELGGPQWSDGGRRSLLLAARDQVLVSCGGVPSALEHKSQFPAASIRRMPVPPTFPRSGSVRRGGLARQNPGWPQSLQVIRGSAREGTNRAG
jgi:hypothetical protein